MRTGLKGISRRVIHAYAKFLYEDSSDLDLTVRISILKEKISMRFNATLLVGEIVSKDNDISKAILKDYAKKLGLNYDCNDPETIVIFENFGIVSAEFDQQEFQLNRQVIAILVDIAKIFLEVESGKFMPDVLAVQCGRFKELLIMAFLMDGLLLKIDGYPSSDLRCLFYRPQDEQLIPHLHKILVLLIQLETENFNILDLFRESFLNNSWPPAHLEESFGLEDNKLIKR
jgi:hypothetical protein